MASIQDTETEVDVVSFQEPDADADDLYRRNLTVASIQDTDADILLVLVSQAQDQAQDQAQSISLSELFNINL